jgi:hypothetical protein
MERYVERAGRDSLDILKIEKVPAQFFFADPVWRLVIVLRQLSRSEHIDGLGPFGQAAQLHVFDHSFS